MANSDKIRFVDVGQALAQGLGLRRMLDQRAVDQANMERQRVADAGASRLQDLQIKGQELGLERGRLELDQMKAPKKVPLEEQARRDLFKARVGKRITAQLLDAPERFDEFKPMLERVVGQRLGDRVDIDQVQELDRQFDGTIQAFSKPQADVPLTNDEIRIAGGIGLDPRSPAAVRSDPRFIAEMRKDLASRQRGRTTPQNVVNVGAGALGLTKGQENTQQGNVIEAKTRIALISDARDAVEKAGGTEEFLSFWNQGEDFIKGKLAKAGVKESKEDRQKRKARQKAGAKVGRLRDFAIQEITGANMGEAETDRLMQSIPSKEDDPVLFEAKMDAWEEYSKIIIREGMETLIQGIRAGDIKLPEAGPTKDINMEDIGREAVKRVAAKKPRSVVAGISFGEMGQEAIRRVAERQKTVDVGSELIRRVKSGMTQKQALQSMADDGLILPAQVEALGL